MRHTTHAVVPFDNVPFDAVPLDMRVHRDGDISKANLSIATAVASCVTTCDSVKPVIEYHANYTRFVRATLDAIAAAQHFDGDDHALASSLWCAREDGLWLEFGVYTGRAMRFIVGHRVQRSRSRHVTHGFDSFRGLPEKSRSSTNKRHEAAFMSKGSFDLGGTPPPKTAHMRWVPGWFNESLPPFLRAHARAPLSFVHLDADLYSSTSTVLGLLNQHHKLTAARAHNHCTEAHALMPQSWQ